MLKSITVLLGMCGISCFRMFIPYFIMACILRMSETYSWLQTDAIMTMYRSMPSWFTSDWMLVILGVAAIVEVIANYNHELHEFLTVDFDKYYKSILNAVFAFGFLSDSNFEVIGNILAPAEAGFGGPFVGAIIVGGVSYIALDIRSRFFEFIYSIDPDNDFYLITLADWIERLGFIGCFLLLIFIPLLLIIFFFLLLIIVYFISNKLSGYKEHHCPNCGPKVLVSWSSPMCGKCGFVFQELYAINALGFTKKSKLVRNTEITQHRLNLKIVKRCPSCANYLGRGDVEKCSLCHEVIWRDQYDVNKYVEEIDKKAKKIFLLGAIFCLIPIVGYAFMFVTVMIFLIRPFRIYEGLADRLFVRIVVKLLIFVLFILSLCFSIAPLFSIIPLILTYYYCRKRFIDNHKK